MESKQLHYRHLLPHRQFETRYGTCRYLNIEGPGFSSSVMLQEGLSTIESLRRVVSADRVRAEQIARHADKTDDWADLLALGSNPPCRVEAVATALQAHLAQTGASAQVAVANAVNAADAGLAIWPSNPRIAYLVKTDGSEGTTVLVVHQSDPDRQRDQRPLISVLLATTGKAAFAEAYEVQVFIDGWMATSEASGRALVCA